jgi:hypothetical protein
VIRKEESEAVDARIYAVVIKWYICAVQVHIRGVGRNMYASAGDVTRVVVVAIQKQAHSQNSRGSAAALSRVLWHFFSPFLALLLASSLLTAPALGTDGLAVR